MTAKSTIERPLRTAIFGGSFNPFTIGHASIVERGLQLFDRLVIAIGINPGKTTDLDSAETRRQDILRLYAHNPNVEVVVWNGLMADLARRYGATFMLRGIRSGADFEYERNMADVNRSVLGVETVFLPTLPEHSAVSSSVVRELNHYGVDTSSLLPKPNNENHTL